MSSGEIEDDNGFGPPTLGFSSNDFFVEENETQAIITVTLQGNPSPWAYPITVHFSTAPGTATPGSDYAPVSGTVTFESSWNNSRTFTIRS